MSKESKRKRKQARNRVLREERQKAHKKDKVGATTTFGWRKDCNHPRITLPGATGFLTGGKLYPKEIDLLIALDTWGLPDPVAYDTDGALFPKPTLGESKRTVYYPVDDRDVPKYMGKLESMLEIIEDYLNNGQNVHVQCIGGHGRTGTIMALLFGRYKVETQDYLRLEESVHKHYCDEAIESDIQRFFIADYFGMRRPPKTKYVGWESIKHEVGESYYVKKDGKYQLEVITGDPPEGAIPAANLNEDWTDWENESEYGYGDGTGYGRDWYENYDRLHCRKGGK